MRGAQRIRNVFDGDFFFLRKQVKYREPGGIKFNFVMTVNFVYIIQKLFAETAQTAAKNKKTNVPVKVHKKNYISAYIIFKDRTIFEMAKFFIARYQMMRMEPGAQECDATGDAQRYKAGLTQKLFVLQ